MSGMGLHGRRRLYVAAIGVAVGALGLSGCLLTLQPAAAATVFHYTGAAQTYTVPAHVCAVEINALGAGGGTGGAAYDGSAGWGAEIDARLAVHEGDVLEVNVGGRGHDGASGGTQQPGGAGGWNGGGAGGDAIPTSGGPLFPFSGGGGGGASDVRIGGTDAAHRVIVASGGGGSAGDAFHGVGEGGDGGNPAFAGDGGNNGGGGAAVLGLGGAGGLPNGGAGTLTSGGAGGIATGPGAPNSAFAGGGGGGGIGGGGGGGWQSPGPGGGGGGGVTAVVPGAQGVTITNGVNPVDGQVSITPLSCPS